MSRNIKTGVSHMDEKEQAIRDTKNGKVLFTGYRDKMCGLFLRENRLLAAQVMNANKNRIGAVYIGKIKNVVKNIDACFLEISDGEICFLARKDATNPILLNRKYDGRILEGDEILIQLSREAIKTKQASVTADISLSNEYAAISIGSRRVGYSGKIEKSRKEEIKDWLSQAGMLEGAEFVYDSCNLPLGLVIRTKANDCTKEILMEKIRELSDEFLSMVQAAHHRTCFSCIRQAPEDFESVLDQLAYSYEYSEILTDDSALYEKLLSYCKEKMPDKSVRLYQDTDFSLSKLYSLEQKMDTALNARIWLKSGGYLIIEPTEALTVIDVNTGKYEATRASRSKEYQGMQISQDTFEKINREAAEEVALQLRLRNLSGIIIVDFINMNSKEAEESLINYLIELVRKDKIKTSVIDITPLGLVEITRKKKNKTLREQFLSDK